MTDTAEGHVHWKDPSVEVATLKERIRAIEHRLSEIHEDLIGFPQLYALRAEVTEAKKLADKIVGDHVTRNEFDGMKTSLSDLSKIVSSQASGSTGRRIGFSAAGALIIAVFLLYLGDLRASIPSHGEIANQIQTEAPWLADKTDIEGRIAALERKSETQEFQIQALQARISQIEALDRFFCRTRTPKLPGC